MCAHGYPFPTVATAVQPLAQGKGITLETHLETAPQLYVDAHRLRQILEDLLSNAVKYSSSGARVELSTRVESGHFVVVVSDSGSGIRPDDMLRIFRPFGQLTPIAGGSVPGTGLGLAITRRLVELHGGTIEAASTVGVGTTITVRLPLTPDDATEPHTEP